MKILEDPRQVSGDWHIFQAHRLLAFDAGRELDTVLVYAAVELRLAIERRMLEILLLLKDHQVSDKDIARCRSVRGMAALMEETDRFYMPTMPSPVGILFCAAVKLADYTRAGHYLLVLA